LCHERGIRVKLEFTVRKRFDGDGLYRRNVQTNSPKSSILLRKQIPILRFFRGRWNCLAMPWTSSLLKGNVVVSVESAVREEESVEEGGSMLPKGKVVRLRTARGMETR
jgi:hypothetical protein